MKLLLPGLLSLLLFSCQEKEDPSGDTKSFPALSFLKSQVRDVDTSLYRIQKISEEPGHSDTSIISREQFHREASPFLSVPDISSSKLSDDYAENKYYDETLEKVVLFYTAKDPEAPLQRQQVYIDPNEGGGLVKTIIIDVYENKNGFSTHRNLIWNANSDFQISENYPGPGGTERIRRTKVVWNDFHS